MWSTDLVEMGGFFLFLRIFYYVILLLWIDQRSSCSVDDIQMINFFPFTKNDIVLFCDAFKASWICTEAILCTSWVVWRGWQSIVDRRHFAVLRTWVCQCLRLGQWTWFLILQMWRSTLAFRRHEYRNCRPVIYPPWISAVPSHVVRNHEAIQHHLILTSVESRCWSRSTKRKLSWVTTHTRLTLCAFATACFQVSGWIADKTKIKTTKSRDSGSMSSGILELVKSHTNALHRASS